MQLKTEVVKKAVRDKLVAKVNNVDTSRFVFKTKYDADKTELENKIPNTSRLVEKSYYNAKISELENKISSISELVTTSALTAVENKIPNVSSLFNKTDCDTKISELAKKITNHKHDKYITTAEFDKLTAESFAARLAQANLIAKTGFDAKLSSLNSKITSDKTKDLLVENQLKKLKSFDLGYFIGKSIFNEDGARNYLIFQPTLRYFTLNSTWITKWKSEGLSNESLEVVSTTSNAFTPSVNQYGDIVRLKFTGSVLQQKTATYSHNK